MKRTRLLAAFASVASIASVAMFVACSSSDRPNGAGGTDFRPPTEGVACTPGQTRECGVEVASHGSYVDCVKGTQACLADRSWSSCVTSGAKYTAKAPAPQSGTDGPVPGSKVVGGSAASCLDNPCNPYCKSFDDLPDTGITSDSTTVTSAGPTITLEASNVPGGFQNKGTLDAWCLSANPAEVAAACQFDMHCGKKPDGTTGCIPFKPDEKDSCSGVDITAPVVCTPDDTKTYRNLTICNRGSDKLTKNIVCMGFPGNSPQYPNDVPGVGPLVLDTATQVNAATGGTNPISGSNPLGAGECRTYQVLNTNFVSNGTESIMCNPYSTGSVTTSYIDSVPTTVVASDFKNSLNATSDTDADASAETTLSRAAMSSVSPGNTAAASGWTSPDSVKVDDGAFAVANFSASAATTTAASPATVVSLGSPAWSATAANVGTKDGARATVSMPKNSSRTMELGAVPTSLGASTTLTSIRLDTTWRTSEDKWCSARIAVYKSGVPLTDSGGAAVVLNSTFTADNVDRDDTTTKTIALTAADIPNLTYRVTGTCTSIGSGTESVSVDYVGVTFGYLAAGATTATVDAGNFGAAGSLPGGAAIDGFAVDVKWKASVNAPSGQVAILPTLNGGEALVERSYTIPATYVANTPLTTTMVWTTADVGAGVINASDLTGAFKLRLGGSRTGGAGFDLSVDSVKVTPMYRTEPTSKSITFSNFAYALPTGASNITVTTYARFRFAPDAAGSTWTNNDWLTLENFSAGTLLSSASANAPGEKDFQLYQIGSTPVTAAQVADPTFTVKVTATRRMPQTGTTTAQLDYVRSRLTYQAVSGASISECNSSNNWTVSKANPPTICTPISVTTYPPWTVTRVFDGVCPVGTKAKWSRFGYDTLTPAGTKVEFRFRTFARDASGSCVALTPVTTSPPTPLATAQLAPTDTQKCDLAVAPTSFCPVDLMTALGADASAECLQMDAYGSAAATPPASPSLNSWRVTYDCVPSE